MSRYRLDARSDDYIDSQVEMELDQMDQKAVVPFKYNEEEILAEIGAYIAKTYQGHYVGEDNVQSLDLIFATGHATGFNIGNILKYGSRYGKKRGFNRDDLLKVIHYAVVELYNHSKNYSRGEDVNTAISNKAQSG